MGNDFVTILWNTIKDRIMPVWTGLRYWTDRSFLRTKILSGIKEILSGLTDIRPRSARDYYHILWLLVSRRLVHMIVVVSGLFCLFWLLWDNPAGGLMERDGSGRVWSYASIPLRFYEGEARIRAKSGYIAYDGSVSGGYASGPGELYDENGTVIYSGSFDRSRFNGEGKLYYATGQLKYEGTFQDDLFQGTGNLYRESGNQLYQGEFEKGMREGSGILFGISGEPVFTGKFHRDEVVYSQLLGKTPEEIGELYTGDRTVYQYGSRYVTALEDIGAACLSASDEESLGEEAVSEAVYVEKDYFIYGVDLVSDVEGLKRILGEPSFEGNSYITFPEAVETERLREKGRNIGIEAEVMMSRMYRGIYTVEEYDRNALVYLYIFDRDGLTYTFAAENKGGGFFLYIVE